MVGREGSSGGSASIDVLLASTKDLLPRRIPFVRSTRPEDDAMELKMRFGAAQSSSRPSKPASSPGEDPDNSLQPPPCYLFPPDRIGKLLHWQRQTKIGCGLENMGNSCFANAVLQSLTYTPPLANYLLSGEHSKSCRKAPEQFCAMCLLEKHVGRALSQNGGAFQPYAIVRRMREIASHFRIGRQEDAHEFARYLIESMQKDCLRGLGKVEPRVSETTVIQQIFGGYLRSQVKCSQCQYGSNKFDPFLDLSLELRGANSVEQALSNFTAAEVLDGENKYRCSKCKKLVRATKRLTIHHSPNVLTIQLKRFDFGRHSGKINKPVAFGPTLDLGPFVSCREREGHQYALYAAVVHAGHSMHSGHYYAYVKSPSDFWHCMDDSSVRPASEAAVLREPAYVLFYRRRAPAPLPEMREAGLLERLGDYALALLRRVRHVGESAVLKERPYILFYVRTRPTPPLGQSGAKAASPHPAKGGASPRHAAEAQPPPAATVGPAGKVTRKRMAEEPAPAQERARAGAGDTEAGREATKRRKPALEVDTGTAAEYGRHLTGAMSPSPTPASPGWMRLRSGLRVLPLARRMHAVRRASTPGPTPRSEEAESPPVEPKEPAGRRLQRARVPVPAEDEEEYAARPAESKPSSSRSAAAPRERFIPPVERASAFDFSGPLGKSVGQWDGDGSPGVLSERERQRVLTFSSGMQGPRQQRDEWDEAYDTGRTKKVKRKHEGEEASSRNSNPFQSLHDAAEGTEETVEAVAEAVAGVENAAEGAAESAGAGAVAEAAAEVAAEVEAEGDFPAGAVVVADRSHEGRSQLVVY
eukprot:tig00000663_g3000.t1